MKKIDIKNPNNLPCIELDDLTILQGDLKTLPETNKKKLMHSIEKHGYFVPAFIWKSDEKSYILDATQRYHVLKEMHEQGYEIPPIPYIEIEASDKKDAAEKLLQITARYGEINPNTSFLTDFDLIIDELEIAIPELNFDKKEESEFSIENFIFEDAAVPCWFVIRSNIENYQKIKEKIEDLKEIENTIIEDSNDGSY
jgi:hypothetical protein